MDIERRAESGSYRILWLTQYIIPIWESPHFWENEQEHTQIPTWRIRTECCLYGIKRAEQSIKKCLLKAAYYYMDETEEMYISSYLHICISENETTQRLNRLFMIDGPGGMLEGMNTALWYGNFIYFCISGQLHWKVTESYADNWAQTVLWYAAQAVRDYGNMSWTEGEAQVLNREVTHFENVGLDTFVKQCSRFTLNVHLPYHIMNGLGGLSTHSVLRFSVRTL